MRQNTVTNFNPRSCEGATFSGLNSLVLLTISIHAPAKERLEQLSSDYSEIYISIHAPAKERHHTQIQGVALMNFNPRSCEGATNQFIIKPEAVNISIHAPAKERQLIGRQIGGDGFDFNPRSCEGATLLDKISDNSWCISIHAPAKERQY